MEHERFDTLARGIAHGLSRRAAIAALAALTGTGLATGDDAEGKKKKKKVTLCRNRQTITVTKKKKQKHLQPGDVEGPCPPPSPPPGPPVGPPPGPPPSPPPGPPPPPRCPPRVPNFCARLDSCESRCPEGKEFDAESCACVCGQPTTCCFCFRAGQAIFFQSIADEGACAEACTAAGGADVTFVGGGGSSAEFDLLNDVCNVICEAEPMTCPAGVNPPTCPSGQSCCPAGTGDGCCFVDAPHCCPAGCCAVGLPLCCDDLCCPAGSACCTGDGDCGAGRVCGIIEGVDGGCCVADLERSTGHGSAFMARMAPAVPNRDANGGRKRVRRNRR